MSATGQGAKQETEQGGDLFARTRVRSREPRKEPTREPSKEPVYKPNGEQGAGRCRRRAGLGVDERVKSGAEQLASSAQPDWSTN